MPRKQQGWITFQSSPEELQLLEQYCQQSQRTKTDVLRSLVRSLQPQSLKQQGRQFDFGEPELELFTQSTQLKPMKLNVGNLFKGTVKRVITRAINTEVTLEIASKVQLISIITRSSAEQLDLFEGQEVYVVIKSSRVMIGTNHPNFMNPSL